MLNLLGLSLILLGSGFSSQQGQTYSILQERNGLQNVFARLKEGVPIRIAYVGGSVTAGAGASQIGKTDWRSQTTAWFKRQYPASNIEEIDDFSSDCGSLLAAFKFQQSVLTRHPDLVFLEFSGTDLQTGTDDAVRAVEGIVRHIRLADPSTEICFVHPLHRSMLTDYAHGKLPPSVFIEETVAAHYQLSSVNFGAYVAEQIRGGQLDWNSFSQGDLYPTDAGHATYLDVLTGFLANLSQHVNRHASPYRLTIPIKSDAFDAGSYVEASALRADSRYWKLTPGVAGTAIPQALVSVDSALERAPITVSFQGTAVGLHLSCDSSGPTNVEYRLDAGAWSTVATSGKPAGPSAVILGADLKQGLHTLEIRSRQSATAAPVSIHGILLNGETVKNSAVMNTAERQAPRAFALTVPRSMEYSTKSASSFHTRIPVRSCIATITGRGVVATVYPVFLTKQPI